MIDQEMRINEVAAAIVAGKKKAEIMATFGVDWRISSRTMDRIIAKAKIKAENILTTAQKTIERTVEKQAEIAAINGLRSAMEVDMRVQDIIFAQAKVIRAPGTDGKPGNVVGIDNRVSDVLRAAKLYYQRNNLIGKGAVNNTTKIKFRITGKPVNGQQQPGNND